MLPIVVAPIVVAVCVGVTKLARAKECREGAETNEVVPMI